MVNLSKTFQSLLALCEISLLMCLIAVRSDASSGNSCLNIDPEKAVFTFDETDSVRRIVVSEAEAGYLVARWEERSKTNDALQLSFHYAASRAIVKLTDGQAVEDLLFALGKELDLDPSALKHESLVEEGRYLVKLDDDATREKKKTLYSLMANSSLVEHWVYLEPDYLYVSAGGGDWPTDPIFRTCEGSIQFEKIQADKAWHEGITGSNEVRVAIIDSGVDYLHADLNCNIWVNHEEAGRVPKEDDDNNGYVDDIYGWNTVDDTNDPADVAKHGTMCAGIIGAVGNNNLGTAGVSWRVSLIPIRAFDASHCAFASDVVQAIDFARKAGAHIISASWAYTSPAKAVEEEISKAGKDNILFVSAAGNGGWDLDKDRHYPATYDLDNILSVAATGLDPEESFYGNYGCSEVDLAAPGVGIWSITPGSTSAVYLNTAYGSSLSTAFVAGAAALVKSRFPEMGAVELKNQIMGSVDKLKGLEGKVCTSGRLNVYQAVKEKISGPTSCACPPP